MAVARCQLTAEVVCLQVVAIIVQAHATAVAHRLIALSHLVVAVVVAHHRAVLVAQAAVAAQVHAVVAHRVALVDNSCI